MKRKQSIMKKNKNDNKTKKNIKKNTKNNNKLNTMNGGGNLNFCTYDFVSSSGSFSKKSLVSSGISGASSTSGKSTLVSSGSTSGSTSGKLGYSGIDNINNTCFMNAPIQMLWSIPEIRDEILKLTEERIAEYRKYTNKVINTINNTKEKNNITNYLEIQINIAVCLNNIFYFFENNKNSKKYYEDEEFLGFLRDIYSLNREQEDASEYLTNVIFVYFSKIYIPNSNNKYLKPLIDISCIYKETSKINCTYPIPNHKKNDKEIYTEILNLEISKNTKTIKDCINIYRKVENFPTKSTTTGEPNYLPECFISEYDVIQRDNKNKILNMGPGTKQLILSNFSNNLIINFKRFNDKNKKLNYSIIPDNPLKIGSDSFQLKGCICHDGGPAGGHYVYIVFDDNGKPIKYISDSSVSDIDPKNTDHLKRGYLYYYRKI